jgi:hypothetical protein
VSAFTPSGSGGLPLVTTPSGVSTKQVLLVNAATAGTEYSATLPTGTRQWKIRVRQLAPLQLTPASGDSGTNYELIPRGCFLAEGNLLLSAPLTMYFQSPIANVDIEITYWL